MDEALMKVAEELGIPDFKINGASLDVAKAAGLCVTVTALDGVLRFYAQVAPTAEMSGIVTLRTKGAPAAAGGSGTLGIATKSTAGAVKPGAGLSVGDDGTLSLDLGNGLKYDAAGKIQIDAETVVTAHDLVDENAARQRVVDILNGDAT